MEKGRKAAAGLTSVARVGAQGGGVVRVDADRLVQEAVALHPAAQRHVLRLRAEDAVVGLRAEGMFRWLLKVVEDGEEKVRTCVQPSSCFTAGQAAAVPRKAPPTSITSFDRSQR